VHVAESLHARDAYVARATRTDAVAVSSVVALSGVLALVLGRWLVGRRVEALIRKAREVGRGELRHPVDVGGADELTTLADELNEMALDLDRARKAAVAEAEARVAAEVQLRHADRLRSVGQLAAGLAHELGTPLNVVAGRAALVERRAADEATRRDAGTIREQTRRISELVRRMLDFSRRPEAARRPCDLDQVAAEVVALLGSTAHRAGVDLRHEPAPAPVRTLADPAQLQQVLANLVLNAIQARGTEVVVGARPCTCEQLPGPHLRLSVADRGPGLAPEILPQLFDPFFTTKPPGEGTGLGLPIAQAIVVEHGGALLAENRADGPGAAFSAHLPLEVPPEAP
jgi:signal transduction histidine kinase